MTWCEISWLCLTVFSLGSHSDYWHTSVREIRATNSITIHTTGRTTEIRQVCVSVNACMQVPEKKSTKCPPVSVCIAEAEELNNRLQSAKQRVSELERTLSSVSTQQKQFEKVSDTMIISKDIKWNMLTVVTLGHNFVFTFLGYISTSEMVCSCFASVSVAQQRTWKGERQP